MELFDTFDLLEAKHNMDQRLNAITKWVEITTSWSHYNISAQH